MNYRKPIYLTLFLIFSQFLFAQQEGSVVPKFEKLRDSLYLVHIGFTNIGILEGPNEILLIDASAKELMKGCIDSILKKFHNKPVKYILNTHSHQDHTGGNTLFMIRGTMCIAQQNASKEMYEWHYIDENGKELDSTKGKPIRYFEKNELPEITFNDKLNLSFADESIQMIHLPNAHTKGDAIIYFEHNNVIALGDNYFGNAYTFGANLNGMIDVYKWVLQFINDSTIILPGHGVSSNKKEIELYLDMIIDVKTKVALTKKSGKTLIDVKADKSITEKYDAKYGKLYMNGERFREFVYNNV